MSFASDYQKLRKKRIEEEERNLDKAFSNSRGDSYAEEYLRLRSQREEDDDIAPVFSTSPTTSFVSSATEQKEDKEDILGLDLFQKGSFGDGFDWHDIPTAILGTAGDVGVGVVKGVLGFTEGVADFIGNTGADIALAFGANKRDVEEYRKNVTANTTEAILGGADKWLDQYSVLGDTSRSVAEGIGQVGVTMALGGAGAAMGLGTAGTTALTTGGMFLSGVGSGRSEAYQAGATDEEAKAYGLISGTADAVSEMIFGGLGKGVNAIGISKGLTSADDILAKKVSNMFTNKIAKNFAELGIKAGAEGFEEVLAGTAQAIGKKVTYMSEEDLLDILEDENLFEQFVVGAVTSGIAQSGDFIKVNKAGRDFVTNLSQNEQKVIDKEYENRIAERESKGEKLTAKDKNKIYGEVLENMERGYISTDTIEEVLGGESYKAYTDYQSKVDAINKEYEALKNKENATLEEQARFREVRKEYYRNKATSEKQSKALRQKLDSDVFNLVKNDRLIESYNERNRLGEDFKYDSSTLKGVKHEEAAKQTYENAIKAGANNSNKVHDMVDMLARSSGDTGLVYDFASAEQLKETFIERQTREIAKFEALENRTAEQNELLTEMKDILEKVKGGEVIVDGDITGNGIVLNLDSEKPWNRVFGHEVTHSLEKAKAYDELKEALFNYAKSKNVDIDKMLKTKQAQYAGVMDANPEAELVADLVGDYLFTDKGFVQNLAVEHRNVFQKIYDEIKYLCKIATAGSQEKKDFERLKRAFEDAYREASEASVVKAKTKAENNIEAEMNAETKAEADEISDTNTQYSIRTAEPPKETGVAYKVFFVKDGKLYPPMVANPDGADTPIGVWLDADMGKSAPPSKTGRPQVKAGGKGTQGGGGSLAFRPGWHLGDLPRASQFDRVNPETGKKELFPENFVWAEVEYAKDVDYQEEAMSYGYTENGKFRHSYAGLPKLPENGYYRYRTNPKPDTVPWVITGAMKVNRLLSDAEVNEILAKNGVAPVHRQGGDVGLDKFGFEEGAKYSLSDDTQGKTLYTGSPVTDIKQFKVGGDNGAKQTGDRYGRGIYLTTNKTTAQGYAGDSGRVYEINADDLNIFDLNDSITEEMKATLARELNGKDKQFRNSILRNFRSEKAFTDFDSAEQFFDEQRKIWKEEDGYYTANKPEILSADDKTGNAVIEYTDFANIDNAIGNLTGNQLYDALKSISTDDFASFITGHGFDGIAFDEDFNNQQYVIYRNEDRLNILNDDAAPTKNDDIRYSLRDSEGNQLSKEQQEFFKDSKARDENGNLLVMYHGSQNLGFTVFDPSASDDNKSFFFSDKPSVAASYSNTEEEIAPYEGDKSSGLYKTYLNLTNPYIVDARGGKWNNIVEFTEGDEFLSDIGAYMGIIRSMDSSLGVEDFLDSVRGDLVGSTDYAINELFIDEDTGESYFTPEEQGQLRELAEGIQNTYNEWDEDAHIDEDGESTDFESYVRQNYTSKTTRKIAEEAYKNGYDGVIFKNVVDVGKFGNMAQQNYDVSTVAVAFDSGQVKSVGNENPTSDPDIRFSLSNAVEETKDLVALHNLTADKLTKSLELGGLPMPSLAITKSDIPHDNFGDITLVFSKETIDPKASKKNKVYSADAWTPIFPNVEYEADSKVVSQVSQKLSDLGGRVNEVFQRDLSRIGYSIEDYLNRQGGEEGLIQHVMENYGLKAAYLEDIGKHIEPVTKQEEVPRKFNPNLADKYMQVMDILGVSTAEEVWDFNLKEARDNHGAELEEVFPGITQSGLRMGKVLGSVASYLKGKDSAPEYKTVIDSTATNKAVDDAIDAEGFEAWTRKLFAGVEKDSGIYNNKDLFTPSGNRRSFKQTHFPVTLENIVKAMASQNDGNSKNVSGFNGIKTLRAATAETFKSIDDMHNRKGRLQHLTQEQADEITDSLNHRLSNIIDAIDNENAQKGDRNPYIRYDQIGQVLTEIGEGGKYNVADIQSVFSEYGRTVSDDVALEVKQLLYDVTQMPVNIFEAKPQRVVGFDEAKVFVIPRNADANLKQELLNRGYSIAEYDPDVEGDRQKVVNQFEEYKFSLSDANEEIAPIGNYDFYGKDFTKKSAEELDAHPVTATETPSFVTDTNVAGNDEAEEYPSVETDYEVTDTNDIIKTVKDRLNAKITNSTEELEQTKLLRDWVSASYAKKIADVQAKYDSKKNKDTKVAVRLKNRIENLKRVSADLDADLAKRISDIEARISKTSERLQDPQKNDVLEVRYERINKHLDADKADLSREFEQRKAELQSALADKDSYISNRADELYWELRNLKKGVRASDRLGYLLDHGFHWGDIKSALVNVKHTPNGTVNVNSNVEPIVREALNEDYENRMYELDNMDSEYQRRVEELEAEAEAERKRVRDDEQRLRRADVRTQKLAEVESVLNSRGFSLDGMLDQPKRQLSTLETVDTMPQRVMEKTFGYEEGQALADATVNKVAQDDTKATKWLDSITNRKTGLLAQLSKEYHIKPGSNAIAAVQMYAEGFFVDENNELVAYGDAELAQDFPNAEVQKNIKALAKDPRIRQFYDDTLDSMNKVLVRNGYPPIPRLDNYYLHFLADDDFLSKVGVPFNPLDAKTKDLPTDLAGQTADLKPGRPFFSSGLHRKGKRTSFDLFGGMERYANMAKNVIYQTDNIQTLRAIQHHLCERFGQAHGLEDLGSLDPDAMADRIQQVYSGHLSTFASFLNTEANILAGKTSMIDRALSEGVLGRRVLTFLDAANKQFSSAAVGGNVSSANTNWLPAVRELATSNPADSLKAFAQTVSNILSGGKFDSFREDSSVYVRRKGADRFNRTLWQKMQDPGFALMGAVDSVSTELIARTEYNKAIREGKSPEQAHYEADKKTSRLMADRSLGQMPQMYTSRLMQLVLKFQLEVRNDLDSMFYDTLQEAKVANKDMADKQARNAKTASQVAWKYASTAVALHLFGTAFESIAGYNPAFDIIEAIGKAFGWDDDDESEDTIEDNLRQGALSLLEDMPYANIILDGGRIPVSSMFPDVKELISGEDEYGNEVTLGDIALDIAPYLLPTGGSQIKKTWQGLSMFSDDHPVAGSYTASGNLRFPVEDTLGNKIQAGLFGQYASKNARDYFDNERMPLKEKQIQEYIDVDIPIRDYWEYREGLAKQETVDDKFDYIAGLDLPVVKKNILINNVVDRKDEVDLDGYEDFSSYDEFDFATKNPGKYAVSQAVGGYNSYKSYSDVLNDIKSDKDENGKTINGSRKEKVISWLNEQNMDYGMKIILFKSEYPADDSYNSEILDYLNTRNDLTYDDIVAILRELDFTVDSQGNVYWD